MDFWDFAITEKPRWTAWGDFMRALKEGKIAKPPSVKHWRDVETIVEKRSTQIDREEIRYTWYRFTKHCRDAQARAGKADGASGSIAASD